MWKGWKGKSRFLSAKRGKMILLLVPALDLLLSNFLVLLLLRRHFKTHSQDCKHPCYEKKTTRSFHCHFFFTHRKKKSHHMSFWGNTWPLRQHISGSQLSFPDQQLASISYAVQHRMQQLNILLLYCSSWIGDKKYPLRCPSMCFLLYSFFFFFFTAPSLTCVWCRSSFWGAATTSLLALISSTLLGGKTLSVSTQSPWMDSTVAFPLKREETIHIHTDVAH